LINALSSEGVTLGGDPVIHSYALDLVRDEVTTLGLLALAMVIAVQIVITRSFVAGACLAFTSALPAVWTLALFPLFGRSISISSAGTPVVVLLLATSYSIHVYRRAQALDFDLVAALDEVTEVIAFAGLTTIAGFLSLAASPGELLRTMGIYVALGSAFALVCALVLLPRLLGWWAKTLRPPRPRPGRHASLPSALVVARRPWLRAGIAALNREGRERLLTAFEQVNANFSMLFTHLFNGGEAKLVMVESDDPLEAGLEIMCQPPGKKLSTLSLLSGGEQTLTALALIFAVFLANPAPICVLDEVDAPLDDANVTRFCDLLDEMRRQTDTRFLIITHHAVTMSRMDRLFGVTMVEQGVSQLVSVDLKRAEKLVA
ncbi:MAG: MMPL family transporter, partial [Rhodosalinus sp.]